VRATTQQGSTRGPTDARLGRWATLHPHSAPDLGLRPRYLPERSGVALPPISLSNRTPRIAVKQESVNVLGGHCLAEEESLHLLAAFGLDE